MQQSERDRRSEPRRGTLVRVGLALTATGIMSTALDQRALVGGGFSVSTAIAFGLALGLLFLATFLRPVRGAAWIALAATAVVLLLAAAQLGGMVGMTVYLLVAVVAVARTAPHLRALTAAAFALWTPSLWAFGAASGPAFLSAPLRLAAMVALAYTVFVLVDPRRVHPSDRLRRAGHGMLTIAVVSAAAARTLVVAPIFTIPDVLAVATVIALLLLHVLRGRRVSRETATASMTLLAFLTYAAIGLAYIVGTPYHADAVVAPHRAAELLLQGREPYAAFDMPEALARFKLDPELNTHLVDGSVLRTYSYPALSFLVVAPFVGLGLGDIRWIYLIEVLILAAVVSARLRPAWRPFAMATVFGSEVIARQNVLAGIDPTWALLLLGAWIARGRPWLSGVLLGLAIADRQTAWFAAPFVLVAVANERGAREAIRRGVVALGVMLLVHAPFAIASPARTVESVLGPLVRPLVSDGVGLMRFGVRDLYTPPFPREVYTALALIALAALLLLLWRRPRVVSSAPLVWPFIALYFAWRSLQNYFAFAGPFALAADDELIDGPAVSPPMRDGADPRA